MREVRLPEENLVMETKEDMGKYRGGVQTLSGGPTIHGVGAMSGGESWYGSSWNPHWGSYSGSTTQEENDEEEMEQILPDAVLGWFLLEKTGLDPIEKSIIQGEVKGNFTLAGVENALRSHWTDDQIRARDGESRH